MGACMQAPPQVQWKDSFMPEAAVPLGASLRRVPPDLGFRSLSCCCFSHQIASLAQLLGVGKCHIMEAEHAW